MFNHLKKLEDAADDAEENNKKKVDEQLLVNLFFCHSQDDIPLKFFFMSRLWKCPVASPLPVFFFNKRRHFSFFDNTNLKKKR